MEKIKQFIQSDRGKDVLMVFIIILVGLSSFELGRLSKDSKTTGIKVQYPDQTIAQPANVVSAVKNTEIPKITKKLNSETKIFFASNRGNKYYPIGCSAGKNIKQENRVYFATKEEAERAGYEPSSSCK